MQYIKMQTTSVSNNSKGFLDKYLRPRHVYWQLCILECEQLTSYANLLSLWF